MQTLESAGLSAAVALALVSLAEIRSSRPAYIAGFFFLFCAILNGAAYTGNKYTGDAVEMYFLGAACNLILMISLLTSKGIKVEMLLMSACFALLSTQYVLMAIDEYASLGEKTWLWSWSYQFRASSDVIIMALGVISAIRNKGL